MTEAEILEGNKLIAEFMGRQASNWNPSHQRIDFDNSWNRLLPVVDDIYYSRRFPTGAQTSEISSQPYKLYKDIEKALLRLSLEQVYAAVVAFIQWYNNNQKQSHD